MDVKQFHRRVLCIALLLSLCLTAMGATLYDLQINQGEALYERSQNKIAETQIVEADRGDILDRNGQMCIRDSYWTGWIRESWTISCPGLPPHSFWILWGGTATRSSRRACAINWP